MVEKRASGLIYMKQIETRFTTGANVKIYPFGKDK
jgi:hypothetical protein